MNKIGRYEVVEELGRGAMGVVYKASDPTIGRLVAIKVLSVDSTNDPGVPGAQEIFMREARAAGRLSHPGIVTIHDALEDPETKKNYIVMELIPGRTLENVLLYGPPLTTEKALDIIRQIAEALVYAHQQQIIHRDLKPANILLTEDGRAKITDFGIAKIMAAGGALRTAAVMGTPAYMSPEQVTGGDVDARSDLFALGILVYLMLAGEKPFAGDTAAVMFKIVYEDPVPPSQLRPELSAGHDYLVLRSLVKDRDKRYGSAREFLDDLDDVQYGRPPRSEAKFPLAEIRQGERTLMAGSPPLPWRPQMAPVTRKKLNWVSAAMGAAVVFLMALLASGVMIYRSRHKPPVPGLVTQVTPAVQASPGTTVPSAGGAASDTAASSLANSKPDEVAALNSKGKTAGIEIGTPSGPTKGKKVKGSGTALSASPAASGKPGSGQSGPTLPTTPAPITAKPATAESIAAPLPATQPPAAANIIQLSCKFELEGGTLTVSNEAGVIFHEGLKGKKKTGLLHFKGGFAGVFSRPITILAETHNLSVRVVSTDGSLDLNKTISIPAPANKAATLQVDVKPDGLNLYWVASSHP